MADSWVLTQHALPSLLEVQPAGCGVSRSWESGCIFVADVSHLWGDCSTAKCTEGSA